MAEPETSITQGPSPQPGQVKELAKALHQFQQKVYAAGKTGKAQGRAFSSLKDIVKTIQDNSKETGLSHAETWHPLGNDHAVLRVTLYHSSGESIRSELPVDITQKNRSGSREQAQGSAMTYARRYLLLGIYGLANDDEDDDGDSTTSNGATADLDKAAADLAAAMDSTPAPAAKKASGDQLTSEEVDECKQIIKSSPDIKAVFIAEFFRGHKTVPVSGLKFKAQLDFLRQQRDYEDKVKKAVQDDVDKVLNP